MRIDAQGGLTTGKLGCLVIGAGPPGSATGAFLAKKGHSVDLLDRRPQMEQKISGECLSPSSYSFMHSLEAGPRIPPFAFRELEGITLVGPKGAKCELP